MNIRKSVLSLLLFLLSIFPLASSPLFNEYVSDVGTGSSIAGGLLPLSFTVSKSSRLQILPEGDEKASLSFLMSYGLSSSSEGSDFDMSTGKPKAQWLGGDYSISSAGISYFNPSGNMSLSLSQKFDDWTYSLSLSSMYTNPQEGLSYSTKDALNLSFAKYENGEWKEKYSSGESVYAYPWLYGKRTNLNNWLTFSASRYITTVSNLDSFNISVSFECGPWWLLNTVSNDGMTLSDYYRISASSSQSMVLKDENQSISLRWLRISISHSTGISYTFGKIVPQNKLGSYRLGGSLSDSVTLSLSGPQLFSSDTTLSMSFSYSNSLYFGHFENVKDNLIFGMAYSSVLNSSFNLSLFGIATFSYHVYYYFADGYSGTLGLRGSGEVGMSFNL